MIHFLHPMNVLAFCKNQISLAVSYIVRLCPFLPSPPEQAQNHDAMVSRLTRMKENFKDKEQRLRLDPFQRTFLEKSREHFSYGFGNRENSLKVKLQMFAGSSWCLEHADQVINQAIRVKHNVVTNFDFNSPEVLDSNWVPMIFSALPEQMHADSLNAQEVALTDLALANSALLDFEPAKQSRLEDQVAASAPAVVSQKVDAQLQADLMLFQSVVDGTDSALDEQVTFLAEPPVVAAPQVRESNAFDFVAHEISSVSDLFLSAQRYFVSHANPFGSDRGEVIATSKALEDSFDDLNMAFSTDDLALFKAAMDGAPLRFA